MWKTAHQHILKLVSYEPGKPVEELAREMGLQPAEIIKLASNENPLGPSPKALAAMREALERAHFYPDGGGWALRGAIAHKLGLDRENVVLGNGSNEIIEFIGHAFLRPGDEVVTARHAFAVYTLMAQLFGAKTVEVPDPGYTHDLDAMLASITWRTRQVFIANPNNPTGTMVGQQEIDRFMDRVPDRGARDLRRSLLRVPGQPAGRLEVRARGPKCRRDAYVFEDSGFGGLADRLWPGIAGNCRRASKDTPTIQREWHRAGGSLGRNSG